MNQRLVCVVVGVWVGALLGCSSDPGSAGETGGAGGVSAAGGGAGASTGGSGSGGASLGNGGSAQGGASGNNASGGKAQGASGGNASGGNASGGASVANGGRAQGGSAQGGANQGRGGTTAAAGAGGVPSTEGLPFAGSCLSADHCSDQWDNTLGASTLSQLCTSQGGKWSTTHCDPAPWKKKCTQAVFGGVYVQYLPASGICALGVEEPL